MNSINGIEMVYGNSCLVQITSDGGSGSNLTDSQPDDFYIRQISVCVSGADAAKVIESTAIRDEVLITMTVGNITFMESVDVFSINDFGLALNFPGFILPKNKQMKIEALHVDLGNFNMGTSTPLKMRFEFFGQFLKEK